MTGNQDIRYLQRQEIDLEKWDACIASAPNGLIYGRSFFLDAITKSRWDALVLEDYRAVMPLPWNRKFGFYYLYQPFCTPCLGIFGDDRQTLPVTAFLGSIPKKFKYWDIDLNEANFSAAGNPNLPLPGNHILPHPDNPIVPLPGNHIVPLPGNPIRSPQGLANFSLPDSLFHPPSDTAISPLSGPPVPITLPLKMTSRINHFLRLDRSGEQLEQDYNRLAKRMCKRAASDNLDIIRNIGPRDVIDLYRREYGARHSRVNKKSYERLTACADKAFNMGYAQTYLALWPDGGIAAFYLVLSDNKFVYSTLGGSTQKGKEEGAFYLLTDAAIKDHASTDRVFRFEGSDIPGIASFNASFGSTPVHYPHLLMNNLPFPIRLLK